MNCIMGLVKKANDRKNSLAWTQVRAFGHSFNSSLKPQAHLTTENLVQYLL